MTDHSESTSFRALFVSALQVYEKTTGITLPEHPLAIQLRSCHSVESMTALVQDQASAFNEFQGKDRVTKSVKTTLSILTKLSATASLGDTVGLPFPPANAIHAGFAILFAVAKGMNAGYESYDTLVDLLESIEHFAMPLDIYTRVPHTPTLDEMANKITVELLSTLALVTKELKQGRTKKWLFGEKDIEAVLQRVDRLTQDVAQSAVAEIFKVIHGLLQNVNGAMDDGKRSVADIRQPLEMLHKMASNKNKSKRNVLQRDIQNWLSPPDPWKNHRLAFESHHEGTAAWFLEGETFSEWKASGPSSLLWMHGKPGAGKSVLCSTIIQEIEAMRKCGLASLAFYYYDFREDKKKDLRGLLSSVLFQLCDQSDSYHDTLSTFFSTHRHHAQKPTDDELAGCFRDLLELSGQAPVYLVIDALDECPITPDVLSPRTKVLILLEDLVDSKLSNLRICVTSRPEADIKIVLEPLAFRSVSIQDENGQRRDIEDYIKSTVHSHREMRRWKPEHKQLVIDTLTARADGMFRWVYCQLGYLGNCLPGRIRNALDELPETLDETYERALREIQSINWKYARQLFLCVSVAKRPLSPEELAECLAFEFHEGPISKFYEDLRPEDPLEAVLTTCSTLLALVNIDDSPVIQFCHFSVKEFLMSTRFSDKCDTISSHFHISLTPAHTFVAQACLAILLHLDENVTEDGLKKFPLAEYAAEHWVEHARFEGVSKHVEEGMKQLFDPRKSHLAVWVWIRDPIRWTRHKRREKPPPPPRSTLHYAAFCGFPCVVQLLVVAHPRDLDSQDSEDMSTPLHLALGRRHAEVVRLLVDYGADLTAQDDDGFTPLHLAVQEGSMDLTRFLIEHGADAKAQDEDGSTMLHFAVQRGNLDISRLLVEFGAEATAVDEDGLSPLRLAVQDGRVDIAHFLINHGANVTTKDEDGSTLLHLAAMKGSADLARLLIEHGVDATTNNYRGSTPLHFAVQEGNLNVTRFLIEHDVNAAAQDHNRSTPLHLAVKNRSVDLARLLLEHGVDATVQDKDGLTPLHLAVEVGNVDLTCLLVKHGADTMAKTYHGLTPLYLAVKNESVELIRLLVDYGAPTTIQDEFGSTLLHLAVLKDRLDLAHLLIEHGADATAKDNRGSMPLHLAVKIGSMDLVRLLMEHGADAIAQDEDGSTPLHLALKNASVDITHFLIEHGGVSTAQDEDGSTPLDLAVKQGRVDIISLLTDHEARVQDKSTSTPSHLAMTYGQNRVLPEHWVNFEMRKHHDMETQLHSAVQEGSVDAVRSLLEHGVDATARNRDKATPLHLAVQNGSADVVRLLLRHGVDATARNRDWATALHLAIQEGSADMVHLLLEHGVDATASNRDGATPLHLAVQGGSVDVVRLLLEHGGGGGATAWNPDWEGTLHLAVQKGSVDVVRLLLEHGVSSTARNRDWATPLHLAVLEGNMEMVRLLLEHGVDATAQNRDRATPLDLAVRKGNLDMVRLFLEHGLERSSWV